MKIAIIVTNKAEYNLTHYNTQEIGLGKALVKLGHEVDIFCFSKKRNGRLVVYSSEERKLIVNYYNGIPFIGRQVIPLNLRQLLSQKKYDIAHLHEYPWIIPRFAAFFLKRTGTKIILIQGMYLDFQSPIKKIYNLVYDCIVLPGLRSKINVVICKTEAARKYIKKKGFDGRCVHVVPVGLDIERLIVSENKPYELESLEEKISLFERKLLYVGLIEKRRSPIFLLQLLERLITGNKQYLLMIIGQGPLANKVKKYIQEKRLSDNILWLDSIPHEQIKWFYQITDLFLLPSEYEIFGMTMLEAILFNKKIVTTLTGGSEMIIKNGDIGYIRPIDIEQWSEVIEKYFEKPKVSDKIDYGSKFIEKHFSWTTLALSYQSIYKKLL